MATLRQLEDKVTIGPVLQGHFKVTIEYRGKVYTCTSTDTMASDAIRYGDKCVCKLRRGLQISFYVF